MGHENRDSEKGFLTSFEKKVLKFGGYFCLTEIIGTVLHEEIHGLTAIFGGGKCFGISLSNNQYFWLKKPLEFILGEGDYNEIFIDYRGVGSSCYVIPNMDFVGYTTEVIDCAGGGQIIRTNLDCQPNDFTYIHSFTIDFMPNYIIGSFGTYYLFTGLKEKDLGKTAIGFNCFINSIANLLPLRSTDGYYAVDALLDVSPVAMVFGSLAMMGLTLGTGYFGYKTYDGTVRGKLKQAKDYIKQKFNSKK